MSGLKEEWVSLMKLRGLGQADKLKNEEIKSRIFNNFYSVRQVNLDKKPYQSEISVKKDYEDLRSQFLQSISSEVRSKTPTLSSKFDFGLKNLEIPRSEHQKDRTSLKSSEIWSMQDVPFTSGAPEAIPDRFEQFSMLTSDSQSFKPAGSRNSLRFFSDLSPVTRFLCNLDEKEEERYLKEANFHESHIFSLFHLVMEDLSIDDLSVITWKEASDFTRGLVFRSQVTAALVPPNLVKDPSFKEKASVSHCFTEQPAFENSVSRADPFNPSKSASPLIPTAEGVESLEKELLEMMDQVNKDFKSASVEHKIKALLKKTQEKLGKNNQLVGNTQIAAVYQFLQEYLKLQEKQKQPVQVKKPMQTRPSQKKSVTPVKSKKLNTISSNSSLASSKTSKWIGGSKYQSEFDDDDWVSMNQEKKKSESRNEMLYKLSMKDRK
jgi:hypothetical protein